MFGIPVTLLPTDHTSLSAYVQAMYDSEILTVSAAARDTARQIFSPGKIWLRVPKAYMALTAGMLPERLRRDFGFPYGDTERRSSERAITFIRSAYPFLPERLRYVGPSYARKLVTA